MELVHGYALTPGQCHFCSGNSTPTVDTGRDLEDSLGYLNRMYICETCVGELADMIGWLSPERAEKLAKRARYAEKRAKKAQDNLDAAREFVVGAFAPDEEELVG